MYYFFFILTHNIMPVFFVIILGYLIHKKFNLDIRTLSKVTFFAFVPALIFVKIYDTEIQVDLLKAALFTALFLIIQGFSTHLLTGLFGFKNSLKNAAKNSVMFYNSGNFGLPLVELIFSGLAVANIAVSAQIMVLMVQNFSTNTIGFYQAGRGQLGARKTLKVILGMPAVYALSLALFFKQLPFDLHQFILWPALVYLKNGLIPVALLTLGVQISRTKIRLDRKDVYLTTFMRLVLGPVIGFILLQLMHVTGVIAQVLWISTALPSAVTTALVAVEFDNEPDFASQMVLTTTLLSAVTLTGVIALAFAIY